MSKLRIVFILSIVILAILVGATIFSPVMTSRKYSEVQQEQLLKTENEWIIVFKISNHEGESKNYVITALIGGRPYQEEVLLPHNRKFTHVHHIRPAQLTDKNISFAIYKEGEDTPIEQITYYID